MSRFEGDFTAAGGVQLSMAELLRLIEEKDAGCSKRQEAIARCLSGEEGWREAIQALGGSFSRDAAETVRLSGGKAE